MGGAEQQVLEAVRRAAVMTGMCQWGLWRFP